MQDRNHAAGEAIRLHCCIDNPIPWQPDWMPGYDLLFSHGFVSHLHFHAEFMGPALLAGLTAGQMGRAHLSERF
jgi:hypothetical protein